MNSLVRPLNPFAPSSIDAVVSILTQIGFSSDRYRSANTDLVHAGDQEACLHFALHGIHEGRDSAIVYSPESFSDNIDALRFLRVERSDVQQGLVSYLVRDFLRRHVAKLCAEKNSGIDSLTSADFDFIFDFNKFDLFPVIVIGDSHSVHYEQTFTHRGRHYFPLRLPCIGGSARGLSNEKSVLNFGQRVGNLLQTVVPVADRYNVPILLKFGQVDIEFVYQMARARRDTVAFDEADFWVFARQSALRYEEFLSKNVAKKYRRNVHICSINAPALSDEAWADGYIKAHFQVEFDASSDLEGRFDDIRKLEIPTQLQRTSQHSRFNNMLLRVATRQGFNFFDDFSTFIDPATRIVGTEFVAHSMGSDCHLDWAPCSARMKMLIRGLLDKTMRRQENIKIPTSTWFLRRIGYQ